MYSPVTPMNWLAGYLISSRTTYWPMYSSWRMVLTSGAGKTFSLISPWYCASSPFQPSSLLRAYICRRFSSFFRYTTMSSVMSVKLPVAPMMQFFARWNRSLTRGSSGANSLRIMMRDSASSLDRKIPVAPLARLTSFSNSLRYISACPIRMARLAALTENVVLSTMMHHSFPD